MDFRDWDYTVLRRTQAAMSRRARNAAPDHRFVGGVFTGQVTAVPSPPAVPPTPCVVECKPAVWYPATTETPGAAMSADYDAASKVPVVILRGDPVVGADVKAYLIDGLLVAEDANGSYTPPGCTQYYVCVQVFGCCGLPLAGASVTIYGYDFAGSTVVGTGTSDAAGLACVAVADPTGTAGWLWWSATAAGYYDFPKTRITTRSPVCGLDLAQAGAHPSAELLPTTFDPRTPLSLIDPGGNTIAMAPSALFGYSRPQWTGYRTFSDAGCIYTGTDCNHRGEGGSATVYYGYDHCTKQVFVGCIFWKLLVSYGAYQWYMLSDQVTGATPSTPPGPLFGWGGGCGGMTSISCNASDISVGFLGGCTLTGWDCMNPSGAGDMSAVYYDPCVPGMVTAPNPLVDCLWHGNTHFVLS